MQIVILPVEQVKYYARGKFEFKMLRVPKKKIVIYCKQKQGIKLIPSRLKKEAYSH